MTTSSAEETRTAVSFICLRASTKHQKNIRLTCSHFCLFDAQDTRDASEIAKQLGVRPEQYESATREPYSFLYVDKPGKRCAIFFWSALKWVYSMMLAIKLFIDSQGQKGQQGLKDLPGPGFKKISDGNYDSEQKKLANLQKCVDEKDAANKKYVDDQFTPVMMTRNVFSKGISMQDGRIKGLPDPASELDAARKKYVDD